MASTSQTGIVNDALAELGSTVRISSIHDESNIASRARQLWPGILEDLIAEHPWNHCLARRALNAHAAAPAFGYERQFQLPADCVRWLPPNENDPGYYKAEREGDFLLSNALAPLNIRYIRLNDDPATWPPKFARAMVLRMAEAMAEGITQDESIKDRLTERASAQVMKARKADGLETGRRDLGRVESRSDWLRGRNIPFGHIGR